VLVIFVNILFVGLYLKYGKTSNKSLQPTAESGS
jgi:hypothetical protein